MTKKLKILLISVLFLLSTVCVCVFAGCKVKYTVEELKEKYNLTSQITYFLNSDGGSFNGSYVKNLYYKTGDMPMNLGVSQLISGSSEMTIKKGNTFEGWYYVETDSDGNPLYAYEEGEEKKVYSEDDEYDVTKGMSMAKTEQPFDFSNPIEEGKHIYLCGDFIGDVKVELHLLCENFGNDDFDEIVYDNNGENVTVKDGEEIPYGSLYIPKAGTGLDNYSAQLQKKLTDEAYTVIDFFEKDESTDTYTTFTGWPIKYPEADEDGNRPNKILYLKVLKGKWNLVSSYEDVSNMFNAGDEKHYIKQDIDCKDTDGKERVVAKMSYFSGTIYGGTEGHTIKNFIVQTYGNAALRNLTSASIFGNIQSNAVIENVTFENVTANFTVLGGHDPDAISFVATTVAEDATFKNVTISGSLNIKLSVNSGIAQITENRWLYGDRDNGAFDKITVAGATCTITDSDGTKTEYNFNINNETEDQS